MEEDNQQKDPLKVFFTTSNQIIIDEKLEYSLLTNNGMKNLEKLLVEKVIKNNEDFTVSVYSFCIIPEELKEIDRDIELKKYKAIIKLKYDKNDYYGFIFFKENRSNFIYDFKFKENKNNNFPPIHLDLNKLEQLKIYSKLLKQLKIKQGHPLSLALLSDSKYFLMGKNAKFYLDFFLELFKQCYSTNEIKTLLMMFKLNKVKLPKELIVKEYSSILKLVESKPNIITKYCSQNDNKDKYYKLFYTLLLYFRSNYEKENINELLNKKENWLYYKEIITNNYEYFSNIKLPEELINEILNQKNLTYEIIKGVLLYIGSIEKLLITINNNIDIISECIIKEKKILKICEFSTPKETDDLNKISFEIEKLLKYQLKKNERFILFGKEFLEKYEQFYKEKGLENTNSLIKSITLSEKNYEDNIELNEEEQNENCPLPAIVSKSIESNDINNNKIEKRIIMPTIGNVSVGKSYFLNSLFGIDFCQVKSGITTKFLLFIRHVDNLKEPKLYNISPLKNKNNSYDFYRTGEIIVGEKNIKDKIEEINNYNMRNKATFYMLEIEIKSIKNKEFLNKVDFLDVPGLNESGEDYIGIYFKFIKDMVKYCLIIFSTENYHSRDSIEVINKVKKNIYVPIENFLLILNKIDKVNGRISETVYDFKKIILNSFSFNCYNNTIVPVNSLKLKSEIQIETDFYQYLNYYFLEYISVIIIDNELSFSDFLQRKIKTIYSESKKKELLKKEINNFDSNILENSKKILINFIEEKKGKGYNLMIDPDDKNDINIIKQFYICFNKRLIIPKNSNAIKEINNYFDKINDYTFPKQIIPEKNEKEEFIYDNSEEHTLLKELNEFFNNTFNSPKLKKFGVIIPLLNKDFKILKNYILNSNLLFLPVLGVSNSGKSSFINCLLQNDILNCDSKECTRRGVIIRYIEEKNKISLYSIKFKFEKNETSNKYYYYTKQNLLSNKIEHIKEIIKILNESYPINEEDSFLLLEINIPVLDDLDLKPEIKNNVCFIDFPGHNTNNNLFFDKDIYQNVLKMSSFFIYMNSGKAFKEESNKSLLSKIFREVINIRIGDINPQQFIDLCLFVFNKADSLEEKEKNLEGIQEEVKEILGLSKDFNANISCSLFSSFIYNKFIKQTYSYKINNFNEILERYYIKFKEQLDNHQDFIGFEKEENFLNYIITNLSKMIKTDFNGLPTFNDNNDNAQNDIISFEIMKKIDKIIGEFFSKYNLIKDLNYEKNILKISTLLIYCKINISKINFYKESYAEETFKKISENINKSSNLKKNEFINHLERCFYFMNIFFRIETPLNNIKAKEDFEKASNEVINKIKNIFKEYNPENIINKNKKDITIFLDERGKSFKNLMKENKNNLEKVIISTNEILKLKINSLKEELDNYFIELKEEILVELSKIGGNNLELNNKKNVVKELSIGKKILIGAIAVPTAIIGISLCIVLGITLGLPSFFINKIRNAFKEEEIKFKEYLKQVKDDMNNLINNFLFNYNNKIFDLQEITIENIRRMQGLIQASFIETDDYWNESKEKYLKIFKHYEKIKNLIQKEIVNN